MYAMNRLSDRAGVGGRDIGNFAARRTSSLFRAALEVATDLRAGIGFAAAAGLVAAASAQTFTGLGYLTGGSDSNAWVSGDGSAAGGYCGTQNGHRAIRWTPGGGMVDLGTLPLQDYSFGYSTSDNGGVVVGYSGAIGGNDHAFRWEDDVMEDLGVLPGGVDSYAQAVSGDGRTTVGDSRDFFAGFWAAFRWTDGAGMTDLPTLSPGAFSAAYGVNRNGAIIVGFSGSSGGDRACRWSGGGIQDLGVLTGDPYSYAYGVSADGAVVVGYSGTGFVNDRAFRWTSGGGMVSLGTLPGRAHAVAYAASADGTVVVGTSYGDVGGTERAFLWTEALGTVDLDVYLPTLGIDLTGWTLRSSAAISEDGQTISGIGTHNGASEAWIATLGATPCPGDLDLDGDVDLADLATLLSHFGSGAADPEDGDLDGDGDVDLGDLAGLLSAFGSSCE